jgi:Restriction endonuclease PvuII
VPPRNRKLPLFRHHRDKQDLDKIFPHLRLLQELAIKHGIPDIFQDNGGKYLQLALVTGLKLLKSREGNDAVDESGREYEIKTLNLDRVNSFTTHHHLNRLIIAKYRKVDWVFAVYRGIELEAVYYVPADKLEPFFKKWEIKWKEQKKDINNPKIPLKFVVEHGQKIFPAD